MAVAEIGGKQYLLKEGESFKVEKMKDKEGKLILSELLLYSDGRRMIIGPEKLKKIKIEASIIKKGRSKKVKIIKHKAKKGYLKSQGHRQPYYLIKIDKIKL